MTSEYLTCDVSTEHAQQTTLCNCFKARSRLHNIYTFFYIRHLQVTCHLFGQFSVFLVVGIRQRDKARSKPVCVAIYPQFKAKLIQTICIIIGIISLCKYNCNLMALFFTERNICFYAFPMFYRCNRLGCPRLDWPRLSVIQCYNMGHNGWRHYDPYG